MDGVKTRNLEQYTRLHTQNKDYRNASEKRIGFILPWVRQLAPATIFDYGAGQSELASRLALAVGAVPYKFDPAIQEISRKPVSHADLVINMDVLEHFDEAEIHDILEDIKTISTNVYFNISTRPAGTILPNGENAHATVRPPEYWHEKIQSHFDQVLRVRSPKKDQASFITWNPGLIFFQWTNTLLAIR